MSVGGGAPTVAQSVGRRAAGGLAALSVIREFIGSEGVPTLSQTATASHQQVLGSCPHCRERKTQSLPSTCSTSHPKARKITGRVTGCSTTVGNRVLCLGAGISVIVGLSAG